jgi:hypothetical protein
MKVLRAAAAETCGRPAGDLIEHDGVGAVDDMSFAMSTSSVGRFGRA